MKIEEDSIDFFNSIPDDILSKIAQYDKKSLERLCVALTLDIQIYLEKTEKELKCLAS